MNIPFRTDRVTKLEYNKGIADHKKAIQLKKHKETCAKNRSKRKKK